MKLKKVMVSNFKQFSGEHELVFNTKGTFTIVYGFNGFGKTRLHTFFYWLFYGTDRDKETVYNSQLMQKSFLKDEIVVSGELEFEHNGHDFVFSRSESYKKTRTGATKSHSDVRLRRRDENGNLRRVDDPTQSLNSILPEELSRYFFFDGEGMVEELIGKKSATKTFRSLERAVNSIFGLTIYDNAVKDVGGNTKNNAIYELQKRLKNNGNKYKPETLVNVISYNKSEIGRLEDENKTKNNERQVLRDRNTELSEMIGNASNQHKIEAERARIIKNIDRNDESIGNLIKKTGQETSKNMIYLLVANNIVDTKEIISQKADELYVPGLNKGLVLNLLQNNKCICGTTLGEDEKQVLMSLLDILPPNSYKSIFLDYKRFAQSKLSNVDTSINLYDSLLQKIYKLKSDTLKLNERKSEIDFELESFKKVEHLSIERRENENKINTLSSEISSNELEIGRMRTIVSGTEQTLRGITKNDDHNKIISEKIEFLESVKTLLQKEYANNKVQYRESLEKNIYSLTKKMLSVKREIKLLDNYAISVKDSTDNEALSKGQAAVITFSYVGGILNSLKEIGVKYVSNEYPLILDAPLSHLDPYHTAKVFEYLPGFSNQIVIFSKENIDEYLSKQEKKYISQINSNDEANIADIRKYVGEEYFSKTDDSKRVLN